MVVQRHRLDAKRCGQAAAHAYFGALVSGADLDYAPDSAHPKVGRFLPAELMPLAASHMSDGRFLLLDFVGDEQFGATVSGNERVQIVRHPRDYDVDALLIRPDGYVAWAGGTADIAGLHDAIGRWFCAK
jgi:hypothetical protein